VRRCARTRSISLSLFVSPCLCLDRFFSHWRCDRQPKKWSCVVSKLGRCCSFESRNIRIVFGALWLLFYVVSVLVLLFVLLCYWSLQIIFGICFCLLLCPCWKRTDAGSNFVVMSSKFVFSLFGFCSGTDWFCLVRRLLIRGCCFLLRWRLSLLQICCRSPSGFFLENHRGFVFFRGTASEHSILFVLVTGSVHFCVEVIEQVHTYVLPFWLHSPFFPLHQACDLFHFPL